MKAAEIFQKKRKASRTSTVTVRRMWRATGRRVIVPMVEIVADAVDAPVVVGAADVPAAAGAVDVLAAAAGIVDAADLAGDDTKTFATDFHGFTRI